MVSNWGNALLDLGRAAEAVHRYEESVAAAPLCIAYNGMSNAFEQLGRRAQAAPTPTPREALRSTPTYSSHR